MPSDYYSTLQISRDADQDEVRKAFRRMAKRFHPDKNPGRERETAQHFSLILDAYETLSDAKKRYIYDQSLPKSQKSQKSQTQTGAKTNKAESKPTSEAHLILAALLNDEYERAILMYERLIRHNPRFRFEDYMSYADSRDCEFLLAEAYQGTKQLTKAAAIYENLIEKERKHPHFRSFTDEVKLRLKQIYSYKLSKSKAPEESIVYFQKLLNMGLSKRDVAWAYKKLAEAYCKMNDTPSALKALDLAFKLSPKLTGAKKICQKLEYPTIK